MNDEFLFNLPWHFAMIPIASIIHTNIMSEREERIKQNKEMDELITQLMEDYYNHIDMLNSQSCHGEYHRVGTTISCTVTIQFIEGI
jgi:hypothetical protein